MLKEITGRIEHITEQMEYVKILKSDYDYLQERIYKLETEESEREEALREDFYKLRDTLDNILEVHSIEDIHKMTEDVMRV